MPRLLVGGGGGFLATLALTTARSWCFFGETYRDVGGLLADAALLAAACSMALLPSHPRARAVALAASAILCFAALFAPLPRSPATPWDQHVGITACSAAYFALGGLCLVRCARASKELWASLLGAWGSLLVLLAALSSDVLETPLGGGAASVVILALFGWRAVVLTRRNAW